MFYFSPPIIAYTAFSPPAFEAISNMATGLCGVGYTGSYIFSQTIFSMRAGVQSRVNGWIVVAAEVAVFAVPFSVTNYLPTFFLGALLLWFGVEIARDWLFLSAFKLTKVGGWQ